MGFQMNINLEIATQVILNPSWRVWLWEIQPFLSLPQMVFLVTLALASGKGFKSFCITHQ
jgi:hypothetical protein